MYTFLCIIMQEPRSVFPAEHANLAYLGSFGRPGAAVGHGLHWRMARAPKLPSTPALRLLRAEGVEHVVHTYAYVERGGTAASAVALGVEEHRIVKTLVFEDGDKRPLIALMHGDAEVSAKRLAAAAGVKETTPCAPVTAERHTGYRVGGTSPFGTRRTMPVFVERTILDLPRILINGGARGVLVEIDPAALITLLGATPMDAAVPRGGRS